MYLAFSAIVVLHAKVSLVMFLSLYRHCYGYWLDMWQDVSQGLCGLLEASGLGTIAPRLSLGWNHLCLCLSKTSTFDIGD